MEDKFEGIIGALFTFIFWGAIVFGIVKSSKKRSSKIPDQFKNSGETPSGGVRTGKFGMGSSSFNNLITVIEQSGSIFFKLPLGPHIAIPLTAIASVKVVDNAFKAKSISISFVNNAIPKITLTIKESQVGQFPGLIGLSGKTTVKDAVVSKAVPSNIPSHTTAQPQIRQAKPYKDSGAFRALILIAAIIVIAYILYTQF